MTKKLIRTCFQSEEASEIGKLHYFLAFIATSLVLNHFWRLEKHSIILLNLLVKKSVKLG